MAHGKILSVRFRPVGLQTPFTVNKFAIHYYVCSIPSHNVPPYLKNVFLFNNSAKMHPIDHMSTDPLYSLNDKSNSGALYHLVTI